MKPRAHLHPHEIGLPARAIRHRRQARRVAHWMLLLAVLTAVPGWLLLGASIHSAWRIRAESPYRAIIAYALLIFSSVTLILGLWYLLVAQVERVARMVGEEGEKMAAMQCANCGWMRDAGDRFCRHCGKSLHEST